MNGEDPSKGLWSSDEDKVQAEEVEFVTEFPRIEAEAVEKLAGVVPVPVAAMIEGSA